MLVAKKITENHGNISKTMREVGYSENTAKKPSNLTNSKGWQKLMKTRLSDDKLTRVHDEALNANKQIGAQILINGRGEVISKENEGMIEVPDHQTRLKAVELAYKIKGRLHSDTATDTGSTTNNIDKLADSIKIIVMNIQHDANATTGT